MTDNLTLADPVGHRRLVLERPVDLDGDGYVYVTRVEMTDDGLVAVGQSCVDGRDNETLPAFITRLSRGWRGWDGVWSWTSMEGEMALRATHDGRGHVMIAVTLRRPYRTYEADAWTATVAFTVEAGEELSRLAQDAAAVLVPMPL